MSASATTSSGSAATPASSHRLFRAASGLFLVYLAVLPFAGLVAITISGANVYLPDFLFPVILLLLIAEALAAKAPRLSRFHLVLGMYVAAIAISALLSGQVLHQLLRAAGEAYLVLIAVAADRLTVNSDSLRRQVQVWVIAAAATAAISIAVVVLFFTGMDVYTRFILVGHGSLPEVRFPRIAGFFLFPNMYCNYLNVSLILALLAASLSWFSQRIAKLVIVLIAVAAFFTLSPGLGGIALAAGLWLWIRHRGSHIAKLSLLAGIIIAATFFLAASVRLFTPIPSVIQSPLLQGKFGPSQRILCWASALHTFSAHPLFGAGPATEVASVDNLRPDGAVEHLTDAHNTWLSIAAHDGILGLAAFVALIIYLLRGISLRSPANLPTAALAIALVTGLLFQGWHGSFEHARHLWVVMGWLAAISHREMNPCR
jgi:O-antigen ligase